MAEDLTITGGSSIPVLSAIEGGRAEGIFHSVGQSSAEGGLESRHCCSGAQAQGEDFCGVDRKKTV